jgi:hypothetical protein
MTGLFFRHPVDNACVDLVPEATMTTREFCRNPLQIPDHEIHSLPYGMTGLFFRHPPNDRVVPQTPRGRGQALREDR